MKAPVLVCDAEREQDRIRFFVERSQARMWAEVERGRYRGSWARACERLGLRDESRRMGRAA